MAEEGKVMLPAPKWGLLTGKQRNQTAETPIKPTAVPGVKSCLQQTDKVKPVRIDGH